MPQKIDVDFLAEISVFKSKTSSFCRDACLPVVLHSSTDLNHMWCVGVLGFLCVHVFGGSFPDVPVLR